MPNDDDDDLDPMQNLTDYAKQLNAICTPGWWPRVHYEIMSGALVWTDETNRTIPIKVIWALRYLVAYRTSLMLNAPREELKPMWEHGLTQFPKWVGFRDERRQPTPKLLKIYRHGEAKFLEDLREIERQAGLDGDEEAT